MAKSGGLINITPRTCRGLRRNANYRGLLRINGVTQVAGQPETCRVSLFGASGEPLGSTRSTEAGEFEFLGLAAARYRLLVEDEHDVEPRARSVYVELS